MPRIELIPANWDVEKGDAAPTVDVCRRCSEDLKDGDDVQGSATPVTDLLNKAGCVGGHLGSVDVDHPSYNDQYDQCFLCNRALDSERD